jgi:hypothetical protein
MRHRVSGTPAATAAANRVSPCRSASGATESVSRLAWSSARWPWSGMRSAAPAAPITAYPTAPQLWRGGTGRVGSGSIRAARTSSRRVATIADRPRATRSGNVGRLTGGSYRSTRFAARDQRIQRRFAELGRIIAPPCVNRLALVGRGHDVRHRSVNVGMFSSRVRIVDDGVAAIKVCESSAPSRGENPITYSRAITAGRSPDVTISSPAARGLSPNTWVTVARTRTASFATRAVSVLRPLRGAPMNALFM